MLQLRGDRALWPQDFTRANSKLLRINRPHDYSILWPQNFARGESKLNMLETNKKLASSVYKGSNARDTAEINFPWEDWKSVIVVIPSFSLAFFPWREVQFHPICFATCQVLCLLLSMSPYLQCYEASCLHFSKLEWQPLVITAFCLKRLQRVWHEWHWVLQQSSVSDLLIYQKATENTRTITICHSTVSLCPCHHWMAPTNSTWSGKGACTKKETKYATTEQLVVKIISTPFRLGQGRSHYIFGTGPLARAS